MPRKQPKPYKTNGPVLVSGPAKVPRWDRGAWLFRDETLRSLKFVLDEAFRIPGTQIWFGVDGLIGLVPGLGDVIGGVLSFVIPLAAWTRGVPYVTLLRMAVNVGIGILVGSVPVAGDIFDVFWKANKRNFRLLQGHLEEPRRRTWRDWAFLFCLLAGLGLLCVVPLLLFVWLVWWLFHWR
jgi:Domain of unknown function (DUF4112)